MTASAQVLQLVRAHFRRDDVAFTSAASALARGAKVPAVRNAIIDTLRRGYEHRQGESVGSAFRAPAPAPKRHAPPPGASSMLQELPAVGFAELLLEPQLQLFLDEIVTELEYREELAARKLRPRSRLLFWGPPGNGKSSSAAALANALDVAAYGVALPRVISKYMGESGQNLGQLFEALAPDTCVVFDEIDALGSRRGAVDSAAGKEANGMVNTMLTLMDRNQNGILIATTNRPDIIDPALLRRFDEVIEFPAPSYEQMLSLSEKLCSEHGVPTVDVSSCKNFDEVSKVVQREARRIVMREILAAEEQESEESEDSELH